MSDSLAPDCVAKVLVVDDDPSNVRLLSDLLAHHRYEVVTASNGDAALHAVNRESPDIVLLDVMMPGMSGYDVCRTLRADAKHAALPIVLVTSQDIEQRVLGLEAGADDFISKHMVVSELLPRVRSLVRVKRLFDKTEAQALELERLNAGLENAVALKVAQIERLMRLKRFVAPALAKRIIEGGADDPLKTHRTEIVVVFFDLRGFTAFSEAAEPEDVIQVLREFHRLLGIEAQKCGGTIERYAGDGVMVFFNDPEPLDAPCEQAAHFACSVMRACEPPLAKWRRRGYSLDIASGIASGFATLGEIGYGDRIDYGAIGTVTNLASRLCGEAKGGQILISSRAAEALPATFAVKNESRFQLNGFREPVRASVLVACAE